MSLVLRGIRKQVADEIQLYDTSADFKTGLNVLVGPTAAGKTSLLRIIAGLDKPTAGQIVCNGEDITFKPVRKRRVAIVYQQYINYPNFTVYENIASPLRLAKLSKLEIDRRVQETASLLNIENLLLRLPSELSGGQQQRVAIARALVKDADIILMDEPLVNLDYKLREQLRRELRQIFTESKKIAIYATTEPLEAALMGDNLVVVDAGKILQSGDAATLFQMPASLRVAEILSDPRINSLSLEVKDGKATFQDFFTFDLRWQGEHPNGRYRMGLRPHHINVKNKAAIAKTEVRFRATVALAEVSGSETLIHVHFGEQHWIVQQAGVHQYQLGEEIELQFSPEDVLLFDENGINNNIASNKNAVVG